LAESRLYSKHAVNLSYLPFFQIVNFGFFAHFMYNMFYGVWAKKSGDPKVAKEKEQHLKKCHVCLKLFFVMGIIFSFFYFILAL
jgi:hypothetical protein